ncbi:MAG: hypothetical protein JSW63_13000 [Ignavibacterium sp.]|nr:MAG: hypothetical protein JSW63_13000 [Ignavibacterium sp.]
MTLFVLQFIGCQQKADVHKKIEPAHIEHIEGSELSRVILTQKAVDRLNITTAAVYEEMISQSQKEISKVVPYSAVIYDKHGNTWVYTNPETRVFIRHKINIIDIVGEKAFLSEGPLVGTEVVKVGAAELYGTEIKVGH